MVPSFRLLPTPPFLTSFGTEVPAMYLPRKACTAVSRAPNFLATWLSSIINTVSALVEAADELHPVLTGQAG